MLKRKEDYDKTILVINNHYSPGSKTEVDYLVLRVKEYKAKEMPQSFETTEPKRIKKTSMNKPISLNPHLPMFEIYCLPEDKDAAIKLLVDALRQDLQKKMGILQRQMDQINNRQEVMNLDEFFEFVSSAGKIHKS
ncbi:hypothetical protein [Pseudomonas putida]|uniref:Uncharacterized protein n=1 Tax=Pseudomonas putida TaxID=303 RepID=A0A8I1EGK8_PSEPU|nr:hypothetical protein [Pseudomonas putida]MBI6885131.1 hypothetical protein [Pseudomonas putida]